MSPSLLTRLHVLLPILSHSDLPQIPQIPKHSPAVAQKPTMCPPPCAYRIEFQLPTQASEP